MRCAALLSICPHVTLSQVLRLREEFHIYCTDDGRFSMAGINSGNIDYLVQSVVAVL